MKDNNNDIMMTIKHIYDEKQASVYNPFNRNSNDQHNHPMSSPTRLSLSSGIGRRRKVNEMS